MAVRHAQCYAISLIVQHKTPTNRVLARIRKPTSWFSSASYYTNYLLLQSLFYVPLACLSDQQMIACLF